MAKTFLNNQISSVIGPATLSTNPMASAHVIAARFPLEGSPNGVPIGVGMLDGTVATYIHTCPQGAMEEIYLWASNYTGTSTNLTLSFGSTTNASFSGSHIIETGVGTQDGLSLIIPGLPCQGGTIIHAKAGVSGTINITGFAVRLGPIVNNNPAAGFYSPNAQ